MSKKGPHVAPVRAKVCQSDPKVAKMMPKWKPRTLPKVVLYADRVKNGTMCDPYIICYVFITSAPPETPHFWYLFATQKWGKTGCCTEVAKKASKVRSRATP